MAQASEHRHTVLLIDDNDDLREAFLLLTATMNLDAVACGTGHAGLAALRDGLRPCLILLDLSMPDMDGFAFRREQLKNPELACIPTAVVSGVSTLMQTEANALGLTTFLRKPVDVNEMLQLFVDHCGAQSRQPR
jgi:CheY-like chemotaxis protein